MAGLFGALDSASRALQINQRGLAITGHNIANVNTPGYTRQRQRLETSLPIADGSGTIGTGVTQTSIDRVRDAFLQSRLVQEHSTKGSLDAQSGVVRQLDALFNESFGDGITPSLTELYNAFDVLEGATKSGQPDERAALVGAAESLISTFHRLDTQMRDLQRSTDKSIVGLLPEINKQLESIALLNEQIAKNEAISPANDLRDEQERVIRELSANIEVTTFQDSRGMVTVLFEGGVPLVEGLKSSELVSVADPLNPFDPTFSAVYYNDGSNFFNVTNSISGGQLGGLVKSRDDHIGDAIQELDSLAFSLVQTVNTQHNLGRGLNDNTSRDFFTLATQAAGQSGSAGEIVVAVDILANAENIAAGGTTAVTGAEAGDITNAAELAKLRNLLTASYQPGDALGGPTGPSQSVIQQSGSLIAARGRVAQFVLASAEQQERVLGEVESLRDQISAVSLDEEVTDLIRLQSSFQANARVITTVNSMLDQLVNII